MDTSLLGKYWAEFDLIQFDIRIYIGGHPLSPKTETVNKNDKPHREMQFETQFETRGQIRCYHK